MYRALGLTTILVAASLAGCAGGMQPGDVELQLTAPDQFQLFSLPAQPTTEPGDHGVVSAIVIIKEIDAKVQGSWTPLTTTPQVVDLLKLDHQTVSSLGIVKLPSGHVSELRFKLDQIGDYVVLKSGDKKPLEVPEIVKVDGKLDLDSCAAGIVILDFDPRINIEHEHCSNVEYELSCKAHIKTEELKGGCGGSGGSDGGGTPAPDMSGPNPCSNVVCMMNQVCVVEGGLPVCMDTCSNLVCTSPEVCVLVSGTPTCVNPGH